MEGRLSADDPIEKLLARATVRIVGERKGSGFFVAPGVLLSAAHVVGRAQKPGVQVELVRTSGQAGVAALLEIDPVADVALLRTDVDDDDAAVELRDDALVDDPLLLIGWPHGVATTRSAQYEGGEGPPGAGRSKHQLKGAQLTGGFSGCPVLNLRTLAVLGVVVETRDERLDLGGYVVPVARLRQALPALGSLLGVPASTRDVWREAQEARARRFEQRDDRATVTSPALPGAAAIDAFIARYRGVPFAGRKREFAVLDDWLYADDAPPLRLITAPAGRGKSALVVNWLASLAASPTPPAVVFVPISLRDRLTDEGDVLRALAARLAAAWKLPAPGFGSGRQALHDFIAATLAQPLPAGRRAVVVIDALDEASGWTLPPSLLPQAPAPGVRILLTARATAEQGQADWLAALQLQAKQRCRGQDLAKLARDDLTAFVHTNWPNFDGDLAALAQALFVATDEGDPLLLHLYAETLGADPSRLLAREVDTARIEQGLERFFKFWWADQALVWGARFTQLAPAARRVFNVLACAVGPIGRRALLEVLRRLDRDFEGDALDEALLLLSRFTLHADGEYVLAHPRFAEHRRLRLQDDRDADRLFGAFRAWANDAISDASRPLDPYLVHHWLLHLEREQAPPEDFRVACTYRWQQAWDSGGDDESGLARDLGIASRQFMSALARSTKPPLACLGDVWAAAFRIAERAGVLARLDPAISAPLLRHGVWGARRALSLVASTGAAADRARALAALIPLLPDGLLRDAEQVLRSLDTYDKHHLAPGWIALARRIDAAEGRSAALVLARRLRPGTLRASVLLTLAARSALEPCSRLAAEAAAEQAAMNPIEQDELPSLIAQAFGQLAIGTRLDAAARAAADQATLAAHRRPGALAQALEPEDAPGVLALAATLPWAAPDEVRARVDRALLATARMDAMVGVDLLVKLAPFVASDQVDAVLASCGESPIFELDRDGVRLLVALSPVMSAEQRRRHAQALQDYAVQLAPDTDRRRQAASLQALVRAGYGETLVEATMRFASIGWLDRAVVAVAADLMTADQARGTYDGMAAAASSANEFQRAALVPLLVRVASFGPDDARWALRAAERIDQGLLRRAASIGVSWRADGPGHFSELSVDLLDAVSRPATHERRRSLACLAMARFRLQPLEVEFLLKHARDDDARDFLFRHAAEGWVDLSPRDAEPSADAWPGAPDFEDPGWPDKAARSADPTAFLRLFGGRIARALRSLERETAEAIGRTLFTAAQGRPLRVDTISTLALVMPRDVLEAIDVLQTGGRSSSDRTDVFASLGARRVVLGDSAEGMRWLRAAPYTDGVATHVADAVRWAPEAALPELASFAIERLKDEAEFALAPLAGRWGELSTSAARGLVEAWITALPQMPLPRVLSQLPLYVDGIERLGGASALRRMADVI